MKNYLLILAALITTNVFAITFDEKEPTKIKLKEKLTKEDNRSSDLFEAFENDITLSIYPYLNISNAKVIISGSGVMENYSLSFVANRIQMFDISGYNEGYYLLQVILPDGDVLSGDFIIE